MEALFGGSFDPVHIGHLVVAEAVGEALQLAVRFLPAREQPFKRAVHHAAPEQRTWMLGLAVAVNPARDLSSWFEVEALPALADVVVCARPGASLPRHPAITRVVEAPAIDVSASMIRERVARGRSIRYLVPEAVREYIAANGLYR